MDLIQILPCASDLLPDGGLAGGIGRLQILIRLLGRCGSGTAGGVCAGVSAFGTSVFGSVVVARP